VKQFDADPALIEQEAKNPTQPNKQYSYPRTQREIARIDMSFPYFAAIVNKEIVL
jgi:hypothetical protein